MLRRTSGRSKTISWALGSLVPIAVLACHHTPPPAPPPPPPPAPAPPPPPPPPPPKCEALTEACVAGPHTKATISRTSWTFEPPAGWTYAQLEDGTLALSGNAAVAVIVYPAPEPKKEAAQRDLMAAEVIKKLAIVTKKLVWPRKPDSVAPGALKVSLYQFDGAKREDKPGALLFFTTKLPDGKTLLGAGFDPEADTSKADQAIMDAVGSIAVQDAPPAAAPAPPPPAAAAPAPAAAPTPTK